VSEVLRNRVTKIRNFILDGNGSGSVLLSAEPLSPAVPEPATSVLLLIALVSDRFWNARSGQCLFRRELVEGMESVALREGGARLLVTRRGESRATEVTSPSGR